MDGLTTCLWFDTQAEEAADFYVSLFPRSRVTQVNRYTDAGPGEEGSALTVAFVLDERPFLAINGGPVYTPTPAVSVMVTCESQEEVDHYWYGLSEGGQESRCGWLVDRYGFSWQIVPRVLPDLLGGGGDPQRASRVMQAMLPMGRLDIGVLQAAYDA